jgi:hypothetical protein
MKWHTLFNKTLTSIKIIKRKDHFEWVYYKYSWICISQIKIHQSNPYSIHIPKITSIVVGSCRLFLSKSVKLTKSRCIHLWRSSVTYPEIWRHNFIFHQRCRISCRRCGNHPYPPHELQHFSSQMGSSLTGDMMHLQSLRYATLPIRWYHSETVIYCEKTL